jgi:hypothetical protein
MGSMPAQQDPSPETGRQQSAPPKAADLIELFADPALSGYELRGERLPDLVKRQQASGGGPADRAEPEPGGGSPER